MKCEYRAEFERKRACGYGGIDFRSVGNSIVTPCVGIIYSFPEEDCCESVLRVVEATPSVCVAFFVVSCSGNLSLRTLVAVWVPNLKIF